MARHLILNLEAPLMSFGGESIDNLGVIRPFPAVSMITGLLANALGWRRIDRELHQSLQDRLVFAARIDREPRDSLSIQDYQNAAINNSEKSWTTRGYPEGRRGGTYKNWQRYRDYYSDMRVTVALRLEPPEGDTTLDAIAEALQEPSRPLFIGRKPCLPSSRLFADFSKGETALAALLAWPLENADSVPVSIRILWPEGEGLPGIEPSRRSMLTDERNWVSGLHGGGRAVCEGTVRPDRFGATQLEGGGRP